MSIFTKTKNFTPAKERIGIEMMMQLQNRYGPIDVVLSIFADVSKKMSFFVLSKEQQQTFDLVVIYSLEFL